MFCFQLLVSCMSTNFVDKKICHRLFYYAKEQLGIPIQLINISENRDWLKTDIGILVTDQVSNNYHF